MGEAEALNLNFGAQSCLLASACLNVMSTNEIDISKLSEILEMIMHCVASETAPNEVFKILKSLTSTYRRLRDDQIQEKVKLREAILLLYKTHQQHSNEEELASWYCDFMTVVANEYRDAQAVDAFAYADFLSQMLPTVEFDAKPQVPVTPKFIRAIRAKTCSLLRAKVTVKHRCILLRLVCMLCHTYSCEVLVSRNARKEGKRSGNFDFSDLHLVTRLLSIEVSLIADECLARLCGQPKQEHEESASASTNELDESLALLTLAYRFFETLLDLLRDDSSEKALELSADEKTQRNLRIALSETLDVVQSLQAELLTRCNSHNTCSKHELLHVLIVCNSGLIMQWWTAETDVEPESASVVNEHNPLLLQTVQFARTLLEVCKKQLSDDIPANVISGDTAQVQLHSLMSGLLALLGNVCMNDELRTSLLQSKVDTLLIDYFELCNRSKSGCQWLHQPDAYEQDVKNGDLNEANLRSLASVLYVLVVLCSTGLSHLVATCRGAAGTSFVRLVHDVMHHVARSDFVPTECDTPAGCLRLHAITLALLCATNGDFLAKLHSTASELRPDRNAFATAAGSASSANNKSDRKPAVSNDSDRQSIINMLTNVLLNGINYVASRRDPAEEAGAQVKQVELCTLAISALCTFLEAHSASATCNYAHELWRSLIHARGLEASLHDFSMLMLNINTKPTQHSPAVGMTDSVPCIRSMQLRLLGTLQRCWHSVRDTAR